MSEPQPEPNHEPQAPLDPEISRENTRAPATAFLIGLAAGALGALLGVGPGLFIVPALVSMLRVSQRRAAGTALAASLFPALLAALRYHEGAVSHQMAGIDTLDVLWLALGSVLGAFVAAVLSAGGRNRTLRLGVALGCVAAGLTMALTAERGGAAAPDAGPLALVGAGTLSGALAGLLGLGGVTLVPVLALVLGYPQHLAQGTSLAVIVPVSLSGAMAHIARDNVVRGLTTALVLGAGLGAWFVSGAVFGIPGVALRLLFGVFLAVAGASVATRRSAKPGAGGDEGAGPGGPQTGEGSVRE